jgi:hypothetical protein
MRKRDMKTEKSFVQHIRMAREPIGLEAVMGIAAV